MRDWIKLDGNNYPDEDVPVLVIPKAWPDEVTTAVWAYEDGWHWEEYTGLGYLTDRTNYEFDDDYEYTHWQPLPEPPKVKE